MDYNKANKEKSSISNARPCQLNHQTTVRNISPQSQYVQHNKKDGAAEPKSERPCLPQPTNIKLLLRDLQLVAFSPELLWRFQDRFGSENPRTKERRWLASENEFA